jgi:hypothetical protein
VVYPKGAALPADFLATKWRSDEPHAPACDTVSGGPCDAFMIDLDGDDVKEVLLQSPINGGRYMLMQVYRRDATGWRYLAQGRASLCEQDVAALRSGGGATAPPALRDLVVNGRHFGFGLNDDCDRPPPRLKNRGGRLNPQAF